MGSSGCSNSGGGTCDPARAPGSSVHFAPCPLRIFCPKPWMSSKPALEQERGAPQKRDQRSRRTAAETRPTRRSRPRERPAPARAGREAPGDERTDELNSSCSSRLSTRTGYASQPVRYAPLLRRMSRRTACPATADPLLPTAPTQYWYSRAIKDSPASVYVTLVLTAGIIKSILLYTAFYFAISLRS